MLNLRASTLRPCYCHYLFKRRIWKQQGNCRILAAKCPSGKKIGEAMKSLCGSTISYCVATVKPIKVKIRKAYI